MNKFFSLNIINIVLLSIIFSSAWAGTRPGIHPLLSDDFSGNLGVFYANTESILTANGKLGNDIGDDIDFENDLGMGDNGAVFIGSLKWRFTQKFNLSFEYITIDRSSSATLNKDINWGDLDFKSGANIKASLDMDMARLFVGYSFIQSKQFELGAGLGLHLMNLEGKISGNAIINGIEVVNGSHSEDLLAPLPNIGLYASYAFSSKLLLMGRLDWFSASYGDYSGGLSSVAANIQYQAFKNIGFGAGYHYFDVDVSVDNDWKGKAKYTYHGPQLFMTVNF